ncbi:MAG TPA: hypothetical protein PKA19_08420, partial [Bacillota bacterium]|nr:hypothetical protein [Bacillota bacterium]
MFKKSDFATSARNHRGVPFGGCKQPERHSFLLPDPLGSPTLRGPIAQNIEQGASFPFLLLKMPSREYPSRS